MPSKHILYKSPPRALARLFTTCSQFCRGGRGPGEGAREFRNYTVYGAGGGGLETPKSGSNFGEEDGLFPQRGTMTVWDRCISIMAATLVVMDAIFWDAPWFDFCQKFSTRAGPVDLEKWWVFYWET